MVLGEIAEDMITSRKCLILGLIVLIFGLSSISSGLSEETQEILAGQILQTTWIVDNEGDGNFIDIKSALDDPDVIAGDTIEVYSGTYVGNIDIPHNKTITLQGIDYEYLNGSDVGKPVIEGSFGFWTVRIYVEDVVVDGFVLTNSNRGFYLSHTKYCVISNNIIDSMEQYGISIFFSHNNTVTGNHILGTPTSVGIDLHVAYNNIIEGNKILSNGYGVIAQYDAKDNLIYNNYFDNIQNAQDDGTNNEWSIKPIKAPGGNIIGGYYIGGNWWSDYPHWDIFDPTGKGISTLPKYSYQIPGHVGSKDYYPIPGFELLVVVGALALVFLLYKRMK